MLKVITIRWSHFQSLSNKPFKLCLICRRGLLLLVAIWQSSWESYSISILLLKTCAIHQRKDCKGHWYFVQSKKVSQRKFNENTILCFYISIFHLLYYSLGNTFNSVLERLIVLQKRAIRIVCGAQKFDLTYPLFQLSHVSKILPLRNLYVYSAQLFLYKYYRQSLPNIFFRFLHHKWNNP